MCTIFDVTGKNWVSLARELMKFTLFSHHVTPLLRATGPTLHLKQCIYLHFV